LLFAVCFFSVKALTAEEVDAVSCTFKVETSEYEDSEGHLEMKVCQIVGQGIYARGYKVSSEEDSTVTKFEIEGNKNVKFLPINVGQVFVDLLVFGVESCSVQTVESGTFDGMQVLESLNLRHNLIETIDEDAFEPLRHLKELLLYGNLLTTLPPKLFAPLEMLEMLNLGDNQIHTLDENLLENSVNMIDFSIWENRLSTVPEKFFVNNQKLESISLGVNKIKLLGVNLFDGLESLKTVDLSDNLCVNAIFSRGQDNKDPSVGASMSSFRNYLNHRCQPSAKITETRIIEPSVVSSRVSEVLSAVSITTTLPDIDSSADFLHSLWFLFTIILTITTILCCS
jgi:Leucine-rich repeat (LRR) protein